MSLTISVKVEMSDNFGDSDAATMAISEHKALEGLYWLSKIRTNHTYPVYQKVKGRRGYLYKRGQDWIVGYDPGDSSDDGGGKLSYIIPGLIQLGAGHLDQEVSMSSSLVPSNHGWLYLTRDRDWLYDDSVIVSPRYKR